MIVVTRTPGYLEHHGIKGQKWGVRNGPPYPLDYEDHNASEKSKNSKGSLDNYENNNKKDKSIILTKVKRSAKTGTATGEDRFQEKDGLKLSDAQKEKIKKAVVIGASAVTVGLAVYGAYKYAGALQQPLFKEAITLGKNSIDDIAPVVTKVPVVSVEKTSIPKVEVPRVEVPKVEIPRATVNKVPTSVSTYDKAFDKLYNLDGIKDQKVRRTVSSIRDNPDVKAYVESTQRIDDIMAEMEATTSRLLESNQRMIDMLSQYQRYR